MKISNFFLLIVAIILMASFQDCDGYPQGRMRKRTAKPSTDDSTDTSSAGSKKSRRTKPKSMTTDEDIPLKLYEIHKAMTDAGAVPRSRRPRAIAEEKLPELMDMEGTGDIPLPPVSSDDTDNEDSLSPIILVPWWNAPIPVTDPPTTKQPIAPKKNSHHCLCTD